PFRASLSSAQDHEHDISNAPLATPVYTVSNFNSLIGPHNGFSGAARIRGWQLIQFYRANGWLTHDRMCSVTGTGFTPWNAFPVSRRAHALIHTRARFPKAWANFLRKEALPDSWVQTLSLDSTHKHPECECSARIVVDASPQPGWVIVPEREFHAT
ncbi:hypothetical protein, partial [Burkholderia pseudomallei]